MSCGKITFVTLQKGQEFKDEVQTMCNVHKQLNLLWCPQSSPRPIVFRSTDGRHYVPSPYRGCRGTKKKV